MTNNLKLFCCDVESDMYEKKFCIVIASLDHDYLPLLAEYKELSLCGDWYKYCVNITAFFWLLGFRFPNHIRYL